MKKIRTFLPALILSAACCFFGNTESAGAATKEDVIAAARAAGFDEYYVQQGIGYLNSGTYTSEQYDTMIATLNQYVGRTDEAIRDYLGDTNVAPPADEPSAETPPAQEDNQGGQAVPDSGKPAPDQNTASPDAGTLVVPDTPAQGQQGTQSDNKTPQKNFSSLTEEEKDKYIAGLTAAEKTQIIKDLDRETQLEIIDSLIDAGSTLGFNISVDNLTNEKIEYSIRNNDGAVVDISSMGIVIDDTGIDYTVLIIAAAAVILSCAGGIAVMSHISEKKG